MSSRIVSVPEESVTRLVTWRTAMMGSVMRQLRNGYGVEDGGAETVRRRFLHCSLAACVMICMNATSVHAQGASPAEGPVILVVGDSLSAEYGIARGQGWVALLEQRLRREGLRGAVVNASVSGDTTSGGKARLPALLTRHRPAVVVIELGGNDALRGLPMTATRQNLTDMARAARAAGARVLIAGMQLPPNYGKAYAEEFAASFAQVAKAEGAALVPFLLKNVADGPDADQMFQPDRIHPTAQAHSRILDNVWSTLRPLVVAAGRAKG